ncbi:uncharacterized protein LOC126898389 [Daktulosphaira vitifoliae]|uniref:uncharacterized protein LOC126898389 n=1 Tax=Daktulosphaira vitifoliae TaxID=58002 RepID=UPI0021A9FF36|nr:uncharacterized protein LOC126898389 [Daktulosphaira vitifoliae]
MNLLIFVLLSYYSLALLIYNGSSENFENIWLSEKNYDATFSVDFLKLLNQIETLETSKELTHLEEHDITNLTQECKNNNECLELKWNSISKYRMKMEALQCLNGIIIQFFMKSLNIIFFRKRNSNFYGENAFYNSRLVMARMLSILYIGRTSAHNWMWIAYFRTLAAENWIQYYDNMQDDHFNDEFLNSELIDYLKMCQDNDYLPKTLNESEIDVKKYIGPIIDNCSEKFYGQDVSMSSDYLKEEVFKYSRLFQVDNFVLRSIIESDENTIFGEPDGLMFNWDEVTKQKLSKAKMQLRLNMSKYEWIRDPFKFIEYQQIINSLVQFKVYFYIWLHLKTFKENIKFVMANINLKTLLDTMTKLYNDFYTPLKAATLYLNTDDKLLWSLVRRFSQNIVIVDQNVEFIIDQMMKMTQNVILNHSDLLGLNKNDLQKQLNSIERVTYIFRRSSDKRTQKLINERINYVVIYLDNVQMSLEPINYYFIKFFYNGNSNFRNTFYSKVC